VSRATVTGIRGEKPWEAFMSVDSESNEPNEFGFSGGATGPMPEPGHFTVDGEGIAIPSDDLTGAISGAIEDLTTHHDENEDEDADRS
jgi:hypothetical protein